MIYDWQYEEAKELGIKPCQCGGAAVIKEIGNAHSKKRCVEMTCSKCHMKRKQCILNGRGGLSFEALKSGVIKDWNTRPIEDEMYEALKIIASGGKGQFQWSMTKAEALARDTISKLETQLNVQNSEVTK